MVLLNLISINTSIVLGSQWVTTFHDDFDSYNEANWRWGAWEDTGFYFNCGLWIDQETWLYCSDMTGNSSFPDFAGYSFYYRNPVQLYGAFRVETEICWITEDIDSFYLVSIVIANSDYTRCIRAGFVAGADTLIPFARFGVISEDFPIPLYDNLEAVTQIGRARLVISRNMNYQIEMFWNDELFFQNTSIAGYTDIELEIFTLNPERGGSGGFNYLSFAYGPSPMTIAPPLVIGLIILVITSISISIILTRRKRIQSILKTPSKDEKASLKPLISPSTPITKTPPKPPPVSTLPVPHLPTNCRHCKAPLIWEDVDWVGPLQAKCPFCGQVVEARLKDS